MIAHYKNTLIVINYIIFEGFYLALTNQFVKFFPFLLRCYNRSTNNIRTIVNHVVKNLMDSFDCQTFFNCKKVYFVSVKWIIPSR